MWPVVVEMSKVLVEHCAGVALVVDQNPVGALCLDAAHESLGVAVRSRCAGWNLHDVDVFAGEHRVERRGELGVSVTDQESELGGPFLQISREVTCTARSRSAEKDRTAAAEATTASRATSLRASPEHLQRLAGFVIDADRAGGPWCGSGQRGRAQHG
jgi:hypothetical protein